jgi:pimeloyl-ACP methyl ester carboxylesterase
MKGKLNAGFVILFLFYFSCASVPRVRDDSGKIASQSIAEFLKFHIGKLDQWVIVRSHDRKNPILLFIPGGPGFSEIPNSHKKFTLLEKYFTLVIWDPRGCGKSFYPNIPKESMNIKQFVSDCIELSEKLKEHFGQQKIFLMGHSWGSVISTYTIKQRPDLFYAYIGIGQITDMVRIEKVVYEFNIESAKKSNNEKALKELTEIGPPPWKEEIMFKNVLKNRSWVSKLGGEFYQKNVSLNPFFIAWPTPEYSYLDAVNMVRGLQFSMETLWPELSKVNFFVNVTSFEIPVYFIHGRHDFSSSSNLMAEYYENITAPEKKLIWFESSGHHPYEEDAVHFQEEVISLLKQRN